MTAEETKALFARRREAFALHDSMALAVSYDEDCVVESPAFGTLFGRTAVERVHAQFFAAFPDVQFQFGETLIAGDRVAQAATMYGTDTGGFLGQGPTGKKFRVFIAVLYVLDSDGITHEHRVYDVNGLLLQLASDRGIAAETAATYRATLERVRLDHDLAIAADVQRALMPELHHTGSDFEVAGASEPCRAIGGDFLDFYNLPSGAFAFVLADVAGKGAPAALLAAQLQGILAAQSSSERTPAEAMERANQVLMRRAVEARFATVLYGSLSPAGHLTYCNAGHNPPLLIGQRGIQRLEKGGLILGAFRDATFEEETLSLHPDDLLVVFSDGLTEAQDAAGAEFGEERLIACVKANRELAPVALLEYLFAKVAAFAAGAPPSDDRTVVALRYNGRPSLSLRNYRSASDPDVT